MEQDDAEVLKNEVDMKAKKERKKKRNEKKNRGIVKDNLVEEVGRESLEEKATEGPEDSKEKKKKKKNRKKNMESEVSVKDNLVEEVGRESLEEKATETVEDSKEKKKKEKEKNKKLQSEVIVTNTSSNGSNSEDRNLSDSTKGGSRGKKKKKYSGIIKDNLVEEVGRESSEDKTTQSVEDSKEKKKKKKKLQSQEIETKTAVNGSNSQDKNLSDSMEDRIRDKKKKNSGIKDNLVEELERGSLEEKLIKNIEDSKEKKKKKKRSKMQTEEIETETPSNRSNSEDIDLSDTAKDGSKDKKRKKKRKMKDIDPSENSRPEKRSKKVRFSDNVEVFSLSDDPKAPETDTADGLVRGKRFTKEEDKQITEAVHNYIKVHGLGEKGVEMLMHCKSHPELKNCWKEIGSFLPHRPYDSVYYRAHTLFERSKERSWTPEELELVKQFAEKHGSDWRTLGDAVGKHRVHVKDAWRRIKFANIKKGHWSQEEYQSLFDMVNMDLRMKAFEEKKSKHGMLRDNIPWSAISEKLETRTHSNCCGKWYNQLQSSMVAEGIWGNTDDYRLLDALMKLDACCIEDVDWDNILEHRSGDVCQKRWYQMVPHIDQHTKSFTEQVEILSQRYLPELIEAREEFDSRPAVE